MNTITATNCWAKFEGPNLKTAIELLTYRPKGYMFTPSYKHHHWDGWNQIMTHTGKFPAGLTDWLKNKLVLEGIEVEIVEDRPPRLPPNPGLEDIHYGLDFWPHQLDALDAAFADERGILWEPTGAGKTDIMIELVARVARPALVLVNRKDLMYQTFRRFCAAYDDPEGADGIVGIIGDGLWKPGLVTIASFQTLYRRLKDRSGIEDWLRYEIGQVHVDETQHLAAASFERVMANLWSAQWRYGYSATPYRSDGDMETFFKVSSWLGPVSHRVEAKDLTDQGHLVPVDVFMIRQPEQEMYYSYSSAIERGIVINTKRNQCIVKLARHLIKSKSGAIVILCDRLIHGKYLAESLKCPFISGHTSTELRARAYDAMRIGDQDILVISKIGDEGLDIPNLQYIIMAGGGKAEHLTIQRVGRGMRSSEGKQNLFVFDFLDRSTTWKTQKGRTTGDWLEKHAKERRATYQNQGAYTVRDVDLKEVMT